MPKAYLASERVDPDHSRNKKYYTFDSRPEKVERYWTTRQSAEHARDVYNVDITLRKPDGSAFICDGFQVEEQPYGRFFVFCEVPFPPDGVEAESLDT